MSKRSRPLKDENFSNTKKLEQILEEKFDELLINADDLEEARRQLLNYFFT